MDGPAEVARARAAPASRVACGGAVLVVNLVPAAARAQMLPQQLAGLRRQQADVEIVPLHLHALSEPAGGRAVVRALDFDAAIEMDRAVAEAVVTKRFDGERAERGRSSANITATWRFRRAVDARVGPVRFPAIEIRLRRLDRLEAQAFNGVFCAWPTPASTFPLRSGSPTRHGSATTP